MNAPSTTLAPTAPVRRRAISSSRLVFAASAAGLGALVYWIYVHLIVGSGAYGYMGIHAVPVGAGAVLGGILAGSLPALWLPAHLRRPRDVVTLYLYFSVHVPTCVLLPVVSRSELTDQLMFGLGLTLATSALGWSPPVPRLNVGLTRFRELQFWIILTVICVGVFAVFVRSGYLSLANLHLTEVYAQRLELMARSGDLGRLFFYAANWTSFAIAPFVILVGLHRRRNLLVLLGVVLAVVSFVVSSNKAAYAIAPAVIGAYFALKFTGGRHLGACMGAAFIGLGVLLVALDFVRHGGGEVVATYPFTWGVFFRLFCNSGFMSAVYLDVFSELPPALFTDSFMRVFLPPQLELSVPALAGASFSEVPDVHANAHLWADGFANLHYGGFGFAVLCVWAACWIYESLAYQHGRIVAAAGLVPFAFTLANTSVHIAAVSNGFFVLCLLLFAWPASRSADQ
jgi:hypothetical protein